MGNLLSARELITPDQTALCVSTDGRFFDIRPDGSGTSGWWLIDPKPLAEKIVVYLRQKSGGAEVYLGDAVSFEGPVEKKPYKGRRYLVHFQNLKLIGLTKVSWKDFFKTSQHPTTHITTAQFEVKQELPIAQKESRLAAQFIKSIQSWNSLNAQACGKNILNEPIMNLLEYAVPPTRADCHVSRLGDWKQVSDLNRVFLNAYLNQEIDRISNGPSNLLFLLDTLESPIEALMLFSLILRAREHFYDVSVRWKYPVIPSEKEDYMVYSCGNRRMNLEIRPQCQVGEHRVDFLLSLTGSKIHYQPANSEMNQKEEWVGIPVDNKIVVECDGHDFHEKTKDQAQRDKKRDRTLQTVGYPVYRFTGSEIYADVFRCTGEIFVALTGEKLPEDRMGD